MECNHKPEWRFKDMFGKGDRALVCKYCGCEIQKETGKAWNLLIHVLLWILTFVMVTWGSEQIKIARRTLWFGYLILAAVLWFFTLEMFQYFLDIRMSRYVRAKPEKPLPYINLHDEPQK